MHQLGLKTGSVDLLTGGYALRNAPDHLRALREMHRVLKPGGCLALLDFVHFSHPLVWRLEYLVLKLWGSLWGALLHRNPGVYRYIAESLRDFPDRRAFYRLLDGYGFDVLSSRRYLFGIVERVCARKR
jgi:demethylmenaquinone methyltransferase/2-methoxy-6-polyprenyl-1,4-benzoquinol methylase